VIPLHISQRILSITIDGLKTAIHSEKVILFLGKKTKEAFMVQEFVVPVQKADTDYFEIPPESVREIMKTLCACRLMIVGQIHTHPLDAFHSEADDRYAIIRQLNAYSIVLPHFAQPVTVQNFHSLAAVFTLNQQNRWEQQSSNNIVIV
jgi:proteasome lid subunit RPN8/RPN11